ncbi:MAG: UDP-N-acetylglucosamine 1-carboxyvinyltransferase [bacterium]|jgi:UDP-N-acetylglucosamine 1-carboxyvinyltransferase|nr:UDP-N-acetylglucosamine 1-carboxyvinyltransferase [bacterium]
MYFEIEGSRHLGGTFIPQGNKNEALPVLAAALLSSDRVILDNLPAILDIEAMLQLAASVGAEVAWDAAAHRAEIVAAQLQDQPDGELAGRIRGSLLLAAPLLARVGRAVLRRPGGDRIGRRRIDTHLAVFQWLGAEIGLAGEEVVLTAPRGLQGARLFLDEASVMATENALMAAALARGETVIENAACEPHVQQLARMLQAMGAQVEGIGTNRLLVQGSGGAPLAGCRHRVAEDHIEVGSLIALAAATESELRIAGVTPETYRMIQRVYHKLGVEFRIEGEVIHVPREQALEIDYDQFGSIPRIHDAPWPGFPADLSSIAVVLACCSRGQVLIHEWMFESRLYWVDSLISMGARITQCDPHRVLVSGGQPLSAAQLHSPDIRAGMALIIAALRAEGLTRMQNIQQVDRGYERIEERLGALGARIRRQGA